MLKNWVLVLYGSSEPIDKYDPVSVVHPTLNRSASASAPISNSNVPRHQVASSQSTSSWHTAMIGSTAGPATTTTMVQQQKGGGKIKSQVGQGNGKAQGRNKGEKQSSGGNRKGGKQHEKNKDAESIGGNGNARKKQPGSSSATALSQPYRKHGNSQGSTSGGGKPNKSPKKEVQVFNELQRSKSTADKSSAYKSAPQQTSEKTIKAPKQVKENANLRSQFPRTSSTTTSRATTMTVMVTTTTTTRAPARQGDSFVTMTTSPSTASTASQTRLSKVLFQKYDRIQQVYPEFHPYVPPISEADKKASLFLAMPNPNSKKQGEAKAFRENGKIIFFSDADFYPATKKPQQRLPNQQQRDGSSEYEQQQQNHRNGTNGGGGGGGRRRSVVWET